MLRKPHPSRLSLAIGVLLAAGVSGCGQQNLLLNGIGDAVYMSGETEKGAIASDDYLSAMCQRAGVRCPDEAYSVDWKLVMLAAFNDVDERCGAYLGSLDRAKRDRAFYNRALRDVTGTTKVILGITEPGPTPLAVVEAAFGFARSSLNNYYSRLILETEKGAVLRLVTKLQSRYRGTLLQILQKTNKRLDGRVGVYYAVRGYLRLCLPSTIEAEINSTVNSVGYADDATRVTDDRLSPVLASIAAVPLLPREGGGGSHGGGNAEDPQRPSNAQIRAGLCLARTSNSELTDQEAVDAIKEFRAGLRHRGDPNRQPSTGLLSRDEMRWLGSTCLNTQYRTAFEKFAFPDSKGVQELHALLSKSVGKVAPADPMAAEYLTDRFRTQTQIGDNSRAALILIQKQLRCPVTGQLLSSLHGNLLRANPLQCTL